MTTPRYPLTAIPLGTLGADAQTDADTDRPTRIILRSYAADDKPRIERLLGLARQLQIPVQLAGPWSCTAFPKGEEAHPALDVVFPEVLVHPRDVLIVAEGQQPLTEIENQLLWAAREDDQRFITGLIELLGLHAEASRGDIAAAVERSGTHYEALDVRVRNILGAVDGEETDEAARRFVGAQEKVHAELGKQLEKEKRETQNRVRTETARLNVAIANLKEHADAWNCRVEKGDLRDAVSKLRGEAEHGKEFSSDGAKERLMGWRSSYTGVANQLAAERMTTAENQRKLLDILRAGAVEPSWERCISYTEARMKDAISERDALKEQLETAITAERQTIAQRIDLALTGNAVITNLDMMLRAVEACREGYTREASNSVNLRRDCEMLQGLIGQIADALDAPPGDRLVVKDDGSLNTTLADRVVGYFKRLYTAAGFTEPPQGGWAQLLAKFERPREN